MTYLPAAMFPSRGAPTTSFEAYKLAPGEPVQHAHALPATAATHTAAATTLGFRELKARTALRTLVPCLLYTSPSPRDRQKSRMPSSA